MDEPVRLFARPIVGLLELLQRDVFCFLGRRLCMVLTACPLLEGHSGRAVRHHLCLVSVHG